MSSSPSPVSPPNVSWTMPAASMERISFRLLLITPCNGNHFLVGDRAKRARHSQVCSVENHDICIYYWANEASPTLGCSIEISRDICACVCCVCQINCIGGILDQTRAYSKSVLGGKIRPVTPVLFISTIR